MEMTNQQIEIGHVLNFDKRSFDEAKSNSLKIIQAINMVGETYNSLQIEPFNQKVYDELTTIGTTALRSRLEKTINSDMQMFKSPLVAMNLKPVDAFLEPVEAALKSLSIALSSAANGGTSSLLTHSFPFTYQHFEIVDSKAYFKEDEAGEHFTKRITNDKQAEVLERLTDLVNLYNDTVDLLESQGVKVPLISDGQCFLPLTQRRQQYVPETKRVVATHIVSVIK